MIAGGKYILETFGETPTASPSWSMATWGAPPPSPSPAVISRASSCITIGRATAPSPAPSQARLLRFQVIAKMSRLQGASGMHTGTMGYGKMEGEASDRAIAYMMEREVADGPIFGQEWRGMKGNTPIISGGMNAHACPASSRTWAMPMMINTCGGGSFGHLDGPVAGATSSSRPTRPGRVAATYSSTPLPTGNSPAPSNPSPPMPTAFPAGGSACAAKGECDAPPSDLLSHSSAKSKRATRAPVAISPGLLSDIATACKAISGIVANGALADILGSAGSGNIQGEEQKKLDLIANGP